VCHGRFAALPPAKKPLASAKMRLVESTSGSGPEIVAINSK
jgi:hypothetical protein